MGVGVYWTAGHWTPRGGAMMDMRDLNGNSNWLICGGMRSY